jgi:endonuclease/exonuclease/phosphatase family metal-dependent hydrolase
MKLSIIFLNTYNARYKEEFFQFLEKNKPDVFCFQEIYSGLESVTTSTGSLVDQYYQMRLKLGEEYYGYHNVRQEDWPYSTYKKHNPWGNAIFVKKGINVCSYFEEFVLGYRNSATKEKDLFSKTLPVGAQSITLLVNEKLLSITNFHGYYAGVGVGKNDTPERLLQSENLIEHLNKLPGSKILGGDFNLNPDTRSIHILEDSGLRNLISDYGITSTRTDKYPEEKRIKNPYADYVFVEEKINVTTFNVDTSFEGSDHAPMFLEINIT